MILFRLKLDLQNVNKDYVIFSYFHNFVTKSNQKPKTKNEMNEQIFLDHCQVLNDHQLTQTYPVGPNYLTPTNLAWFCFGRKSDVYWT